MNEKYAREVIKILKAQKDQENLLVWIHDYSLMLIPKLIREECPTAKIGFFFHIPFPSTEIFRVLSEREEILTGLLGSNIVGFNGFDYLRHFINSCVKLLGLATTADVRLTNIRELMLCQSVEHSVK
jgi:trehalose 6-phosphate synthase/phosphatase